MFEGTTKKCLLFTTVEVVILVRLHSDVTCVTVDNSVKFQLALSMSKLTHSVTVYDKK